LTAGSLCWFAEGTTDSRPGKLSKIKCLNFLPYSHCPHYHSEKSRRPLYHKKILSGEFIPGYAVDDKSGIYREHINYSLNAEVDSSIFMERNRGRRLVKLDHGSIPHNSICNLNDIEHVFYSFHQRPEIQFTSDYMSKSTDLPKISDHNIIYMGGFRNLRQLGQIIAKLQIEYKYTDTFSGEIQIRDTESDSLITFKSRKFKENRYLDLGFIAKLPGPNFENYLFLVGFAYPAQIETVRMISRQESLDKLYNQVMNDNESFPEYFYMIIEVPSF